MQDLKIFFSDYLTKIYTLLKFLEMLFISNNIFSTRKNINVFISNTKEIMFSIFLLSSFTLYKRICSISVKKKCRSLNTKVNICFSKKREKYFFCFWKLYYWYAFTILLMNRCLNVRLGVSYTAADVFYK